MLDLACDENYSEMLDNYCLLEVCNAQSCIVEGLTPLTPYFYCVRANYYMGRSGYSNTISTSTITSVHNLANDQISTLRLSPNPLSSTTKISYSINRKSQVALALCDMNGICIFHLVENIQSPGAYAIDFEARYCPPEFISAP